MSIKLNLSNKSAIFKISFGIVLLLFSGLYSLFSILPHAFFQTHALDLGMFNHALYSYAHLKANHFTLDVSGAEIPYLGDHFSPLTMLYAPFYYLFGSYTLLVIQIISILGGGIGIYWYARYKEISKWLSLLIIIHFFTLWGIYSALSFDFHNNVVAAMLVPWFILYFDKGNLKLTLLFFLLILMSKENMALWMFFIILGLLLRKNKPLTSVRQNYGIGLGIIAFIWFFLAITVIMPAYAQGMGTDQMARYQAVGNSPVEIIKGFFTRPGDYFTLLFEDTLKIGGTGIKSKFWFLFLVSGGFAVIMKPHYLVMVIPVILQKMFSDNIYMWGTFQQYSIEFVPIISLSIIGILPLLKTNNYRFALVVLLILTSFYFNTDEQNRRIFHVLSKEHLHPDLNVTAVRSAMEKIPENAIISTSSDLAPHVAFRDKIYHFPVLKDAEYIALLKNRNPWPLKFDNFYNEINTLKSNPGNKIIFENDDLLIIKVVPGKAKAAATQEQPIEIGDSDKIRQIENEIRSSDEWMREIRKKAEKNKISVDSMLKIDAVWIYNERKKGTQ